jgi:glutathione-regulated potassium-efflux system ancillary protein KefG
VGRQVDTEDLIDAHEVAAILGLEQSNSVTTYLRRYPEMPRPVIEKGGGRVRLWVRRDVERWNVTRPRRPRASRWS